MQRGMEDPSRKALWLVLEDVYPLMPLHGKFRSGGQEH